MKKKIASIALAAAALGGTAALIPAVASAQDEAPTEESVEGERPDFLSEALAPFVENGTLTQAEADEITESIRESRQDRGFRHRGFKSAEALTDVLGIDAETLREERMAGNSIADIAAGLGIDVQTVIDSLVADANAKLDAAVAEGRIDAAEADEKRAGIEERITARVNGEAPAGGFGPSSFDPDGEDADTGA